MDAQLPRESRFDRRRADTKARILDASNRLFAERGYAATSMGDIADAADVATRTLYLHFDSKAAILLAYVDEWLDAYVAALVARPVDENIASTVAAALQTMREQGWNDNRAAHDLAAQHPVIEFMAEGPPEIAGHVLQRWIAAQDAIASDVRLRGGFAADSLVPRARAGAVFASWLATMLAFRDAFAGVPIPRESSHTLGEQFIRELVGQPSSSDPRPHQTTRDKSSEDEHDDAAEQEPDPDR